MNGASGGFCTRCGSSLRGDDRFCKNCGNEVSPLGTAPPGANPSLQPSPPSQGQAPSQEGTPVANAPAGGSVPPYPPLNYGHGATAPPPPTHGQPPAYGQPPYSPPGGGYSMQTEYAGFWLRFVAIIIDSLILWVFLIPLSAALGGVLGVAGRGVMMPEHGLTIVTGVTGWMLGVLVQWLYFALMESSGRQATLGKMAIGLVVTDERGARLTFLRATGRYFAKFISTFTLLIGYIMAGFTARKQALHDMLAGTLVLKGRRG